MSMLGAKQIFGLRKQQSEGQVISVGVSLNFFLPVGASPALLQCSTSNGFLKLTGSGCGPGDAHYRFR